MSCAFFPDVREYVLGCREPFDVDFSFLYVEHL